MRCWNERALSAQLGLGRTSVPTLLSMLHYICMLYVPCNTHAFASRAHRGQTHLPVLPHKSVTVSNRSPPLSGDHPASLRSTTQSHPFRRCIVQSRPHMDAPEVKPKLFIRPCLIANISWIVARLYRQNRFEQSSLFAVAPMCDSV
jgi:hypothetical protein